MNQQLSMEVDDSKNLYEVEQEYDGKDDFPQRPITNLQIHDTVPAGRKALFVLLGVQAFIILILIILLGINGVTLTHLNTVDICDSSAGTSGGLTSTVGQTEQLNNITAMLQGLQSTSNQLRSDMAYQTQQMINTTRNATGGIAWKIDDIHSFVEAQGDSLANIANNNTERILQATRDSAQKLLGIVNTLSNLQDTSTSTAGVVDDILLIAQELLVLHNESAALPTSCKEIKERQPLSPSGYYILVALNGDGAYETYCNMGTLCDSGGGWTRLAYLDMTDATQNCPSGFGLYQQSGVRACGRSATGGAGCVSETFTSHGMSYSQICGRVLGYQYRSTDASVSGNINSHYVDGVSLTRGSPRQHVWTFINGWSDSYNINPCNCNQQPQAFIGNNYFCESGNPTNNANQLFVADPLWDGQNCGQYETSCCSAPGIPWFHRDYGSTTTTDYIELRACGNEGTGNEDTTVGQYEIYVK